MVIRAWTYLLGTCETGKVASLQVKENKRFSLIDI